MSGRPKKRPQSRDSNAPKPQKASKTTDTYPAIIHRLSRDIFLECIKQPAPTHEKDEGFWKRGTCKRCKLWGWIYQPFTPFWFRETDEEINVYVNAALNLDSCLGCWSHKE